MKKSSRVSKVVETVEAELAPSTPCAPAAADKVTALTVRIDALPIPEGSPAEQANALHREFIQSAVSAKIRAVQCGWVLAAQRERIGSGQWIGWVRNLDFSQRTAYNYITAYEGTVGAYRAQQRRPLPLSVEPTMEEISAATAGAQEKPLAQLYRATGVVENNPNHGGARGRGAQGRGRDPEADAAGRGGGDLDARDGRDRQDVRHGRGAASAAEGGEGVLRPARGAGQGDEGPSGGVLTGTDDGERSEVPAGALQQDLRKD